MLIDTHCHLHDPEFFSPAEQADFLQDAHQKGIDKIICIGTNPEDSQVARAFARQHENVFWTYGIHPEFAVDDHVLNHLTREGVANLREHNYQAGAGQNHGPVGLDFESATAPANSNPRSQKVKRLVAIGEIGLDYHYDTYNRPAQLKLFEQMLHLATRLNLPVSLHVRGAFDDALSLLDNFPNLRGVVHSFTGSKKVLAKLLARDFFIGVNGLCTYSTLPLPPLEKMLLETDAPFLTPTPFRGKINAPGYVSTIADFLAVKLDVPKSLIAEQTTKNATSLFKI